MRVAVVDWRDGRRNVIADLVKDIADLTVKRLVHVHCIAGKQGPATGISYEMVKKEIETLAADIDVVLLHVGDDQILCKETLGMAYADKYCVCYSGSPISPELTKGNPKHCCLLRRIPIELQQSEIEENLRAYFEVLGQDPDAACEKLNGFDPELEAKLNLLYACLGGAPDLEEFTRTPDWKCLLKMGLKVKEVDSEEGKTLDIFITDCPQGERLRILRDTLLPQ